MTRGVVPGGRSVRWSGFLRHAMWTLVLLAFSGAFAAATTPPTASVLYDQLRTVGLDTSRVYTIREASLDREDIHVTFTTGTIAFGQDVQGHVTAAFFEGDGEILVVPPNRTERTSMALFTGAAILE